MKKIVKVILPLVILMIAGCAGSSRYMVKGTPIDSLPSDKSVVYFMRPSGMGFAINFQIWDGDHFIGLSQAKSYFAYVCDPGKHLFMGFAENKVAVDADLAAGKTYYIGTAVRMGAWKARMLFTPVVRGSELWNKVEDYKKNLSLISSIPEETMKWEAKKKAEAQQFVNHFKTGEGKNDVVTLSIEDGR
ncbi:MAG: hypothetical protein JRF25_08675 [Deltaproteobacteria bacterium]|nr:hypothetical protein [Deltaproteobacteria bacterium]